MEMDDFARALGKIEGKLDSIVSIVGELKGAFDSMEKGRLSKLEVMFATLETQVALKAKNSAVIYGTIAAAVSSVLATLGAHFLHL